MNLKWLVMISLIALAGLPIRGRAAHPLITDDTGTQGQGQAQVEVNGAYGHEDEDGAVEKGAEVAGVLSYGVLDSVDLVLGLPYAVLESEEEGETDRVNGIGDATLEVKWRFYEIEGWSFALKPGLRIPTGNDDQGLGAGKVGYGLYFITTKELDPLAFHLNAGYMRNENNADERLDLWHLSLAAELQVLERLTAVANVGGERNTDPLSSTHPAFALAGFVYSLADYWDVDAGFKAGLNAPETDYEILAGTAVRF